MMLCKLVFPSNEIFKLANFPNTFSELLDAIRSRIGEPTSTNFSLKYKDFENELVTLNNEEDFQTAILSCKSEQLQTLKVFILTPEASSPREELTPKRARQSMGESSAMINSQVEAMSGLIGMQVKKAVEENMKTMLAKIQVNERLSLRKGNSSAKKLAVEQQECQCVCEECGDDITGVKFICLLCDNYKCCENCEDEAEHPHPLLKFKTPNGKLTAQSAHGSIQYKFNMQTSPQKSSSMLKRSLTKSMKEKKVPYTGQISFNNLDEQPVKVHPAQIYICQINIRNTGKETWPSDVRLNCVNGIYRNREETILALEPGAKQTICLNLEAPMKMGRYLSQWRLYFNDEQGKQKSFGESLFLEMYVEERKSSSGGSTPKKNECYLAATPRMRSFNNIQLCLETPKEAVECGVSENKGKVAGYLNEIFPGQLREKIAFVEKFSDLEVQDMPRMVELYLISLSKGKARSGCKPHGYNNNSQTVSVTL